MVLIVATIVLAVAILAGTIALVLLDEMHRPSSDLRRLGGLLALVMGGAGMWLLISSVEVDGVQCGSAVGAAQALIDQSIQAAAGCFNARLVQLALSATCILGGTVLVLFTRHDWTRFRVNRLARSTQ